jgi:2-desacetyl-2-hydroxyethyl bacteriochlorophyllide A dehydrogenase
MKAVRLVEVNAPLRMQELPVPDIGRSDVLVRVRAAGICHSDAHYRSGLSPVKPLPMTLGHEIAGIIEQVGTEISQSKIGTRICLHYNITCGNCYHCASGNEQFCPSCLMLGHYINGGYAEFVVVPERNVIPLPDEIPFEQGATLMCASATSFHALRKSRLKAGERVAVFGIGGLGMSAIQLARAFGAMEVYAVDINEEKLKLAAQYGALPVNAKGVDPVVEIRKQTNGKGVDVSLELIGLPQTMHQAVQCLSPLGRAVIAGLSNKVLEIDTYRELLGSEAEVIGSNDHLLQELPMLVEMSRRGILDTSRIVTRTIPLDADAINETLDRLEQFGSDVRTVILP